MPDLQIYGGNFQDLEGNPLNKGYLLLELSHDESATNASSQTVAGLKLRITLDSMGSIPLIPATNVWSSTALLPSGSFYIVRCFKSDGTEAWAVPQYWTLVSTPNPLNVGTIVPSNPPGAGGSGGLTLLLQTNSVNNGNQSKLNLKNGTNIAITDDGVGGVTVTSTASGLPTPDIGKFSLWTAARSGASTATSIFGSMGDIPNVGGNGNFTGPLGPTATEDVYATISTTSPTAQSEALFSSGSTSSLVGNWWTGRAITFEAKVMLEDAGSLLNARVWVGLLNGTSPLSADTTDTPAGKVIAFRYSSAGSASDWFAVTAVDASNITASDTLVLGSNNVVTFKIIWTPGVSADFYINGVLVNTNATNIPPSNVAMFPFLSVHSKTGATSVLLDVMYVYVVSPPV